MFRAIALLGLMVSVLSSAVNASGVTVTERTRTYRVTGTDIQAVVRSMKQNGPVSEQHGRRALGMADYRYRTNIKTKKSGERCHVTNASVVLQIFYILPKLSGANGLSRRDQSKWRRIRSMIKQHERQHGRFYRRFAAELQRALTRMPPQRNCSKFKKLEKNLRAKFEKSNTHRNRRFDRVQYKPFNRRLKRLAPKRN